MKSAKLGVLPVAGLVLVALVLGLLIGGMWNAISDEGWASTAVFVPTTALHRLRTWLDEGWIGRLVATWFGSIGAQLFSMPGCWGNCKQCVRRLLPGRAEAFYDEVDFVVSVTFAPALAFMLTVPESLYTAAAAGLGWNWVVKGAVYAVQKLGPTEVLTANLPPPDGTAA